MKNIKLWFPFVFATIFIVGCDDKLDLEPRQSVSTEVAVSTGENVQNILIGTYNEAGQDDSYGGYFQIMSDLYGIVDQATWGGTFQDPREFYQKNIFIDNAFVANFWINGYEVINQANIVLDNANIIEDEDAMNTAMGEAYFLRALTYFDLNRLFSSPDGSLGVPLTLEGVTDYSQDLEIPRASSPEVYEQVISDLTMAIDLLPETNGIFADKYSAEALLARVQLQVGDYPAALAAADDVIEFSGHSLTDDFSGAFNNDSDSSEDLFAFQVTTQDGENDLVLHYADQPNGGRGGDITVNQEYIDLFDATDERGMFFYISANNGGVLTSKYTNQFGNIPFIRLAEMYLIRAEANARLNSEVGNSPVDDINILRERAGAELLGSVSVEEILLERELELMFEGFTVFDYKRTGRNIGELSPNANALSFPIPQREMDANNLLDQNPGYEAQ